MWFNYNDLNTTEALTFVSGVGSDYKATLGRNTTKFDACGAYVDGEAIAHASKQWSDCL